MSKTLVAFFSALSFVIAPIILITWLALLVVRAHYGGVSVVSPGRLLLAGIVPIFFALREVSKKSLTLSGIFAASVVGFVLTLANLCFIASILVFFLTSSKLTKFRAERKAKQDEEASEGSVRTWLNVLNNGGVPTALASLYAVEVGCKETAIDFDDPYLYVSSWLSIAVLGAVASACGDTWASEVGAAVGKGTATLITTGETVPAGTNGGVTVVGTVASACGGAVIGLTYAIMNYLTTDLMHVPWFLIGLGATAGFLGSFLDSLFGATAQYSGFDEDSKKIVSKPRPGVKHISGVPLLNNHAVNFITCFITSMLSPFLCRLLTNVF
ncbi:transmembrane protein 19-like isoform X2 [Clavelina lepadiformis]|uniref:transmembrane protein 19-like isoform X2 n=1 Tax=Clavelina lepadiformis TaxID=159417 RepID=UPI0040436895